MSNRRIRLDRHRTDKTTLSFKQLTHNGMIAKGIVPGQKKLSVKPVASETKEVEATEVIPPAPTAV